MIISYRVNFTGDNEISLHAFLCPCIERSGSILLFCCLSVRLSVCLSAQTLHKNLTFSHYSYTNLVTRLIFGTKAHLIDTYLQAPRSRSSAKVKVKYQGHVSQKMGVLGALVLHKHILLQLHFKCLVLLKMGVIRNSLTRNPKESLQNQQTLERLNFETLYFFKVVLCDVVRFIEL